MEQTLALSLVLVVQEKDNGTQEAAIYTDANGNQFWVEAYVMNEIMQTAIQLQADAKAFVDGIETTIARPLYLHEE